MVTAATTATTAAKAHEDEYTNTRPGFIAFLFP